MNNPADKYKQINLNLEEERQPKDFKALLDVLE
jgi:hypothetical protein